MLRDQRPLAFVLGMGMNGLAIARSLGREGIGVIGADFVSHRSGLRSRYCKPLVTPDPGREPENALEVLMDEAAKLKQKPILYVSLDLYFLFASRFRRELSERFLCAMPPDRVAASLVNKRKQYDLAHELGIPQPTYYTPEEQDQVEQIKNAIEYPAFIKPYYSHIWHQTFQTKGFRVNNAQELVERYRQIFRANLQAVVQSIVIGPDSNLLEVYVYMSQQSEPVATFVTRNLRKYPINSGFCTYMASEHNHRVLETALECFRRLRYIGLGSIELKEDERDGQYKLIEINPRLGMQNILAARSGINFPLIQYLDLLGHEVAPVKDYRDGVKWLNAAADFLAFCQLNRRGELPAHDWLRSLRDVTCHAFFAPDDIRPFLSEYAWKLLTLRRSYAYTELMQTFPLLGG